MRADGQLQPLRPTTKSVLRYIVSFIEEHNYPPTVREIRDACAFGSTATVDYCLGELSQGGYITRVPRISRGIQVIHRDPS